MTRPGRGLAVYLAAAIPARSADAGAVVASVLAGTAASGPATGGLLAAALTIPHLVGPIAGRLLDRRRRPGPVLAAGFGWYAAFVAAAAAVLPASTTLAAVSLALAGCAGPLVTGGLSSRLAGIVSGARGEGGRRDGGRRDGIRRDDTRTEGIRADRTRPGGTHTDHARADRTRIDDTRQRRAQALDALTYGVGGTVGPAAVAGLAALLTPRGALAATAVLLIVGAVPVLFLPASSTAPRTATTDGVLRLLAMSPPLRRTTVATIGSACALAASPVIAAALAAQRGAPPSTAALLMSAYGAGGLAAALALIARPLTGDPERLVRVGVAVAGAALLLPLLVLPFPAAGAAVGGVAFALVGAAGAALFAATLAARTEYAPPGTSARVFATVAGLKVGGSALGVAAAGLVASLGPIPLILAAATVCALTLVTVAADSALTPAISS